MLSIKLLSLLITIALQGQAVRGESRPAICTDKDYAQSVCALLTYTTGAIERSPDVPKTLAKILRPSNRWDRKRTERMVLPSQRRNQPRWLTLPPFSGRFGPSDLWSDGPRTAVETKASFVRCCPPDASSSIERTVDQTGPSVYRRGSLDVFVMRPPDDSRDLMGDRTLGHCIENARVPSTILRHAQERRRLRNGSKPHVNGKVQVLPMKTSQSPMANSVVELND
ncbi:uncharacterized protein PGTG_09299 [Puccinia graminis f. sp. tritici CRL 75-36-700-3]|uniref:Uncharacterized protein n=1 Tax=Puccinia graminis f. sp. tritici (strain CRL 75-36-700-3 / race SCCL) TaxID=418459 RepID=E3KH11_PUCGT|nr:uncharacterized protein PGTG_09299 [Puccinia graminis f. sp. tritici CRL 75-36-700-3]EFP83586.2 hypothetical protein PGTG_09299 [Puccinia graminis f. sp. tritici CRL 75-36-700-3]